VKLRPFYLPVLALLLLVLAGEGVWMYWDSRQPKENVYDPIIVQVGREEGVDPLLIRALIWRESRFNPRTYGTAQEHGLMQVRPTVGQEWAKAHKIADFKDDDLFDPTTNIRAGTWYLSRALRRWNQTDDPPVFALAEYNAGRSNALKWVDPNDPANHMAFLERIAFPTTHKYVEIILHKREEYREKLADNRWYRGVATTDPAVTQAP
jgi:soluble lytic murein transglycosylase